MRTYLFLALVAATVGCATSSGGDGNEGAGGPQFPTRAALDKIAAAPAPTKLAPAGGLEAEGWKLTGPLPDSIEPMQYSDGSPWQALLEQVAASRAGLVALPASMHCVAQENGLFFLAKRALPAERLSRFIAGRCGAFSAELQVAYLDGEVPAGTSAERIVEHFHDSILKQLQGLLKGGAQQVGIWLGQRDGRAVVMVAVATRRANLDSLALTPAADGQVVIRGEVLEPTEHIEGIYNRGRFSFGRCTLDPHVALPHFAATCMVDPADPAAWIEIAAFPAGRVLGNVVADLLVFPSQAPSAIYHDARYVDRAVPAGADARAQLLALVNEVRRGAGIPEVALATRQSEVAERVAPHYFAAVAGAEPELVADEVVLGLRAGWEVEGEVVNSEFAAGAQVKSDDLGRLLDSLLERPAGRAALLDHAARLVALGPVIAPEQQVVALVATSYLLFSGANHEADAQRLLGRLTKARIDRQMSPPTIIVAVQPEAQEGATRVQRGESLPVKALKRMLERSAERLPGVQFKGWVFETSTLDQLTFPPELVRAPIGGVAIAVTHYRPKNSPWSRLVVFILAAAPGNGMTTAARSAPTM